MKKVLALILSCVLLMSICAVAEETVDTPLVVTTDKFSEKFSPFYYDTTYDRYIVDRVHLKLETQDRTGGVIYNAIEGETVGYNGTDYAYTGPADFQVAYNEETDLTTYTIKLRDDILFSDGTPANIDDVIFSYYVLLDPAYVGSTTLNSYDIVGLKAYQTQIPDDSLEAVAPVMDALKAAPMDYTVIEEDSFTQAEYDEYRAQVDALWKEDLQAIVDYVFEGYAADYAEQMVGKTVDEVAASDGLKIALGMAVWGFATVEEGVLTTSAGTTFKLDEALPTIDDFHAAAVAKYEGSMSAYLAADESAIGTTMVALDNEFMTVLAKDRGIDLDAGVPNISGIKKIDDYTMEVVMHGFSAPAIYAVSDVYIVPRHYYGDGTYDYEANNFGHPFNDLSCVQSKTATPMGAGDYVFEKYENRVAYLTANELYYKGAPATKHLQYKETNTSEVATAIQTGTADGGELAGSKSNFEMLRGFNSNNELTGDVVTTYSVAYLGYGYLGLNADTVNVGGEPGSEASKNLRKALSTVLSVYRETSVDSYYGDAAAVINYPISSVSWASPQATDENYHVAYSFDVAGNPIYTAEMTTEEKYDAALQAAIGYLKAAGYTYDEATGKFTAAPEGAKLSYEVIIPADGIGDHPAFAMVTDAKNALESIGIELKINDPADSNVLWDALDAGVQELWTAAWSASPDPDMYQVYHSSNVVGQGGSDSNHFHIRDEELDALIIDARNSPDQSYRKELYKEALNVILDWGVILPTYQRQDITVVSTERVDTSSVTPDITPYWMWLKDIQNITMLGASK